MSSDLPPRPAAPGLPPIPQAPSPAPAPAPRPAHQAPSQPAASPAPAAPTVPPAAAAPAPAPAASATAPATPTPPHEQSPVPAPKTRTVPTLQDLLAVVVGQGGSDLHIAAAAPSRIRVHGALKSMKIDGVELTLSGEEAGNMLRDILTVDQQKVLEENKQLDFAYEAPGLARFRCNFFMSFGRLEGVFRIIPRDIKTMEDLRLPSVLRGLTRKPRGLVLVTGPTGSGKSTTLAAMIDEINRTRPVHILTMEDPIEFLHESKQGLIRQREKGADFHSFADGMKAALRQDPDVILLGEMRDAETMELAVEAAETGHVVFATLHTQDASQTVDRIVQTFPAAQQNAIRNQLSMALMGVVTQQLVPTANGRGRVAAVEVLIATSGVRNQIRENKSAQLYSAMQTGAKHGMQTMEMSLSELVLAGQVSKDLAAKLSSKPEELDKLLLEGMQN